MESKRRVISLLVDNQSGVLARVSSLFCRRGFNIDSLTVSATNDPTVSRITVAVSGTEKELNQLILQTERLEVTRQVFVLNHENALERELLLLKVAADVHNRAELREVGSIYKAKIIDLSPDSMVFELIGKPEKIDAFLKMFADYTILELCRTGAYRNPRRKCATRSCPCRERRATNTFLTLSVSAYALPPLPKGEVFAGTETFAQKLSLWESWRATRD